MFNNLRSYFTPFKILEWAVVFVAVTIFSVAVYAVELPKLQSHVNDYANVLSRSDQQRLNGRLTEFETKTPGHPQIVILTVPSLNGEDLDSFTNDVFHEWKLGHAKYNNGVLALFAMAEHKNRIEVGYDLEPTLTDTASKHILDSLRTQEKAGNWYGAFSSMIDQLTPIVAGAAKEDVDLVKNVPLASSSSNSNSTGFPIMSFLFLLVFIGVVWYMVRQMTKPSVPKRTSNMDTYSNTSDGYTTKHRSSYTSASERPYYPAPPVNRPYAPPSPSYDPPRPQSTSSTLGSAAVGFGVGMATESLLNNSHKKRDNDDDSYTRSSNYSSPTYSSPDPTPSKSDDSSSTDNSYSGGGGDSGGGGSDSSW